MVSSAELARALGVSLQSLANWRGRGNGPPITDARLFNGNRSFYRIDHVLEWMAGMDGHPRPAWQFSRDFLSSIFDCARIYGADDVVETIGELETARLFAHVWRPRSLSYLTASI